MSQVIDLKAYVGASASRLLVLVDLQEDNWPCLARCGFDRVLDQCRTAVQHARYNGIPIAFTRPSEGTGERRAQSPWLPGLEPKRADMVFERQQPSCYGNSLFNDVVSRIGSFAMCGLGAEQVALATAIDAAARDHHITFLSDASASCRRPHADGPAVHSIATAAIELFADVATADQWLVATAPRPLRGHRYG